MTTIPHPLPARRQRGSALRSILMLAAGVALGIGGMWLAGARPAALQAAASGPAADAPAAPASGVAPVSTAAPGEAAIRETLAARIPDLPRIDEISRTPVAGLYEVRIGSDLIYSDERGQYLVQGSLIDTASRANLTQERVEKLTAIDFATLPTADAMVWKSGTGARKVAYFADPNCGYCKRFERDIAEARDVTLYIYLLPILGPDSLAKSRDVWCAKDRTATWRAWMLEGKAPPKAADGCNTEALERNLALSRKHRINGTPALVFEDGKRIPGAMSAPQFEQQLQASSRKS
jgi:thiol:disulfide interchange protein DsbC